MEEEKHTKRD